MYAAADFIVLIDFSYVNFVDIIRKIKWYNTNFRQSVTKKYIFNFFLTLFGEAYA